MSTGGRGSAGNVMAALASLFVPGLGQLLQGRVLAALFFFLVPVCGYALTVLVIPFMVAILIHFWSVLDAATWRPRG